MRGSFGTLLPGEFLACHPYLLVWDREQRSLLSSPSWVHSFSCPSLRTVSTSLALPASFLFPELLWSSEIAVG